MAVFVMAFVDTQSRDKRKEKNIEFEPGGGLSGLPFCNAATILVPPDPGVDALTVQPRLSIAIIAVDNIARLPAVPAFAPIAHVTSVKLNAISPAIGDYRNIRHVRNILWCCDGCYACYGLLGQRGEVPFPGIVKVRAVIAFKLLIAEPDRLRLHLILAKA